MAGIGRLNSSKMEREEESIVYYKYMPSPIGSLLLGGQTSVLELIGFSEGKGIISPADDWIRDNTVFNQA